MDYEILYENEYDYEITEDDIVKNQYYPCMDSYTQIGYDKRMLQCIAEFLDEYNDDLPRHGADSYSFRAVRTSKNRVVFDLYCIKYTYAGHHPTPDGYDTYPHYEMKRKKVFSITGERIGHHVLAAVCSVIGRLDKFASDVSLPYPMERF